jgi:hypothetical protein
MSRVLTVSAAVLAVALIGLTAEPVRAQGKKSDSVVKAEAKADKPDADGKQVVTITLTIDKPWHLYANPVGNEDLLDNATVVTITGKNKPEVKVEYPEGKVAKDTTLGDYRIYEGEVKIKATVKRAKGDTGDLDVSIKVQACDKTTCLFPATIKLTVP